MLKEYIKLKSIEMDEGEGAKVKRLFPTNNYDGHHDPFILMDEFFVSPPNSFPLHEHRGFEAITYMLEGAFRHEDNLGNKAEVGPGGIQAFNAGKGIKHSESPGGSKLSHGIQLWINLPANKKESEPDYQPIKADKVPESKSNEVTIRSIAGKDTDLSLKTEISYKDIKIPANKEYDFFLPAKYQGIIYIIEGILINKKDDSLIHSSEGLLISKESELKFKTKKDTRIIELKGKPHGNKIRIKGTFVE